MEKFSLTGGFKKLRQDLSQMSGKEKLQHLWTYYKWTLLVAVLIIAAVSLVVTAVINKSTTVLASGVMVNKELSAEGQAYLNDDLFEALSQGGLEKVNLNKMYLTNGETVDALESNYYTIMSLAGLSATGELDYVIMDKTAMEQLAAQEMFLDLTELFQEEELSALGDKVLRIQKKDTEISYPGVINITELPFIKDNMDLSEKDAIYIGFAKATPRQQVCKMVWQRINAWGN